MSLRTNLRATSRSLDHAVYDGGFVYGLEFDGYMRDALFGYEFGASVGSDGPERVAGGKEVADFYEVYLGVRKTWNEAVGAFSPFVAAGATYAKIDRKLKTGTGLVLNADWTGGGYVRLGAYRTVGRVEFDRGSEFILGCDIRFVKSEDVDWVEFSLIFGFGR